MNTATALVPTSDLERWADTFARSQMFGAKTKEQALSLLLLAQAEGVHPAIAMRDFDIIQGRPAKKAEAMQRSFLQAGGKIEWHALTDEKAEATFSHPQGGTARITWDMARAKKAGLSGKDMYAKYPRQMLKARVVSEGCRTVYPASTSGLYVPEEVSHFAQEKNMGAADVVADVVPPEFEHMSSAEILKHFKPLLNDSKTLDELKAVGALITPELKARMEANHVAELREDYIHREAQLQPVPA